MAEAPSKSLSHQSAASGVVGFETPHRVSNSTELQVHWIRELAKRLGLNDGELRLLISTRLRRSAGPDLIAFMETGLSFAEAARLYRLLLSRQRRRAIIDRNRQGATE